MSQELDSGSLMIFAFSSRDSFTMLYLRPLLSVSKAAIYPPSYNSGKRMELETVCPRTTAAFLSRNQSTLKSRLSGLVPWKKLLRPFVLNARYVQFRSNKAVWLGEAANKIPNLTRFFSKIVNRVWQMHCAAECSRRCWTFRIYWRPQRSIGTQKDVPAEARWLDNYRDISQYTYSTRTPSKELCCISKVSSLADARLTFSVKLSQVWKGRMQNWMWRG
jgi:hypothetical protein